MSKFVLRYEEHVGITNEIEVEAPTLSEAMRKARENGLTEEEWFTICVIDSYLIETRWQTIRIATDKSTQGEIE